MSQQFPAAPARLVVPVRRADLGRDETASTLGVARWLEDARIRTRLPRFEALVASGGFPPFRILAAGVSAARAGTITVRVGDEVEAHCGIRHIGSSSFTYADRVEHRGACIGTGGATVVLGGRHGALQLPDCLVDDLTELQVHEEIGRPRVRASAAQRSRGHYRRFTSIRARVADLDSNRHVNSLALLTWYDEAVAELAAANQGTAPPIEVAADQLHIDYLGEVTYPGTYEIGLSIEAVDATRISYQAALFRHDSCLGTARLSGPRGDLDASTVAAHC